MQVFFFFCWLTGSFTTDVESRTTELTVQVAINANDGQVLEKPPRLREIIANDFPTQLCELLVESAKRSLGKHWKGWDRSDPFGSFYFFPASIDDPSIIELDEEKALSQVGFTVRVGCGDVEGSKETLRRILDADATNERLDSTVRRLGDVGDDKTCAEAAPTVCIY
uniref:Uncharacterized protein n=1 Tax=Rhodosorus marinus TaxID=101924 RepID=A0A7S2ZRX5_9RHOD